MVGHSKWSKVKQAKGPLDVERGAQSGKAVKEITVAARLRGDDLGSNLRPRSVVETDHAANTSRDNIARTIKKGTGELAGARYEAYVPGGVAMVIKTATNNKNRTNADPRFISSKRSGRLAASDSVLSVLPDNSVTAGDGATTAQVLHLYEALKDNDDTQHVYSNFDISEEVLARLPA